jgi:hypothetical protein
MRVARGMFRLWLVLSCLWIATVAAIGYSSWPSTSKDPKAAYDSKTSADDDFNSKMTILDQASKGTLPPLPDLKDESLPPEDPNNSKTYPGPVPEYLKHQDSNNPFADAVNAQQSAQQLAVTTAKLALIPPALIFIVGIGLTWAFRGFRYS